MVKRWLRYCGRKIPEWFLPLLPPEENIFSYKQSFSLVSGALSKFQLSRECAEAFFGVDFVENRGRWIFVQNARKYYEEVRYFLIDLFDRTPYSDEFDAKKIWGCFFPGEMWSDLKKLKDVEMTVYAHSLTDILPSPLDLTIQEYDSHSLLSVRPSTGDTLRFDVSENGFVTCTLWLHDLKEEVRVLPTEWLREWALEVMCNEKKS